MSRNDDPAILIAGPTASGKSALALALARRLGAAVVNADSMQVYEGLRVLTARPSPADEAVAPHLLYGHVPPQEAYSAGRYAREAAAAMARARAEGKRPIVVGGTGLYFKALLEGLAPVPPVPEDVRGHWRAEAERLGAERLHALLAARDPDMAGRLRPSDPQRVTRALEVLEATGKSLATWQRLPREPVLEARATVRLVVAPERDTLHARCDARFDAMLEAGAVEEAAAMARRGLDPALPAMRALGLAPLLAHIAGTLSLADAAARAKADTRQYAKRQMTWLRGNMLSWKWLDGQQTETTAAIGLQFIDGAD